MSRVSPPARRQHLENLAAAILEVVENKLLADRWLVGVGCLVDALRHAEGMRNAPAADFEPLAVTALAPVCHDLVAGDFAMLSARAWCELESFARTRV
jgi:hypothetical protein